MLTHKNIETVV